MPPLPNVSCLIDPAENQPGLRDVKAAKRFLSKVLNASHTIEPRVITVDKNAAYPPAIAGLKADESLPEATETRQSKYLNNLVE